MRLKCPKCGGRKMMTGYGMAAGVLGGYTFCNTRRCGALVELQPDLDGMEDEQIEAALKGAARIREREGLPPVVEDDTRHIFLNKE